MMNSGLKVLLIDDTVLILQRLQSMLSGLPEISNMELATSAEEALIIMEYFKPDILVLDINMPGMGGIEMLRKVTGEQSSKPVIIMLTNNTFAGYRDECMRLGADYFLDKSREFIHIPDIVQQLRQNKMSVLA
ncbi:MAG: response regulator [Bacteroidota bacterium]|nr:response regulator [Bacteroidota bacterium]